MSPPDPMPADALFDTFMGLDSGADAWAQAKVALVRGPYDGTVSYRRGTAEGPQAILMASRQLEPFDTELARCPADVGIYTEGDWEPDQAAGPESVLKALEARCLRVVDGGKLCGLLGGEHSLTLANARAIAACHPLGGDLSFLVIDAHFDLRDSYQGSPFSHACVSRRLLDLGRVHHVGVRCACEEEIACVKSHDLTPLWASDIAAAANMQVWIDQVVESLGDHVYVSLDVDGLDPSLIPATGTPVPGGLGWYQTLALLKAVGHHKKVVGFDLVELAPFAHDPRSDFAAAQLVYKMIGYFCT